VSGTFAPAPGAAPLSRQVAAQAAMETRLLLRNGEQLLLAVVIPVVLLVAAVKGAQRLDLGLSHAPVDVFTPGVLALVVMSTSFTSLAITTGFERRYGVLKRLGASPLPRHGLLLAKVLATLLVQGLQAVVVCGVGLALGWQPAAGWAPALLTAVLATAAFGSFALLLAGTLRAEATLAAANVIYVLLLVGGGLILPSTSYGSFAGVVAWLPSAALGDAMRAAFLDGAASWSAWAVLLVWAAVGSALASRWFSWE
jgi:ABC-2 type transport system permease protein